MSKNQSFGDRLYQGLLRLLPFDFRSEFGSDMEETFRQQRTETAREHGLGALAGMWWTTIVDILRMAPREHLGVICQDTGYALRMMRKNPGFTAAAVLILGLGIGVNTSIFSVVHSVLLKPLPYTQGAELVCVRQKATRLGRTVPFSATEINDYRQQSRSFSDVVEYHSMAFTLYGGPEPLRVRTGVVSPRFFEVFGVKPLMGRTFIDADDNTGAPAVLVLSYEFWKKFENGDPAIIGKTYRMNDRPHTIVGVLPPIPQYPRENDVYMPTSACPFRSSVNAKTQRDFRMMLVFARLKHGESVERSRSDLAIVAEHLRHDYPKYYPADAGYETTATSLHDDLTKQAKPLLEVLMVAAIFVLLITCANVANLILSRMARREQELLIRTAVGAGSGRLLRQLLTESLILALLAAGLGVLLATGSLKVLTEFTAQLTPRAREIGIDGWVLAFATLCAAATTVVFGSVAALYTRNELASGLKESGRSSERSRTFVRRTLIAAQVAFSYILLVGAGLMVRSFLEIERVDPGFTPQHVLTVNFYRNWSKYRSADPKAFRAKLAAYADQLIANVDNQPGVMTAAIANSFPLDPDNSADNLRFQMEGDTRPESQRPLVRSVRVVTPEYFHVLGIPLLSGRGFTDYDRNSSQRVAVVNRSLAHDAWGQQDPVGKRISIDDQGWIQVVGVAGDTKEFGLNRDTPHALYLMMNQNPDPESVLVRTAGDPLMAATTVRRAIFRSDPDTAITHVETLEQARADSVSSPRTTAQLFGFYSGLAFLIAVAGIGSMLGLWVGQRTQEIGLRMALGARPADIVRIVLGQGMGLVFAGLAAGLAGGLALTRLLRNFLFQVTPNDAITFAGVATLLLAAAALACYIPARKAARVDPQTALRRE